MSSAARDRLLARLRDQLSASFMSGRPIHIAAAPGRLDVMGGILHTTGGVVCHTVTSAVAAVAVQQRDDRDVQLFSFNEYDANRPFTLRISLDALAHAEAAALQRDWTSDAGRRWAALLAGPLAAMHEAGRLDLADQSLRGVNVAVLNEVAPHAGLASSTAVAIAAMQGLAASYGVALAPLELAQVACDVPWRYAAVHAAEPDAISIVYATADTWTRVRCTSPSQLLSPLPLPAGMRVVGVTTGVRHAIARPQFDRTRIAAAMGHRILLDRIGRMASESGKQLVSDPMRGDLANLDHDAYRTLFRPHVPELLRGRDYIAQFGDLPGIEPELEYAVRHAADHHVLEARRLVNFSTFITNAAAMPDPTSRARGLELDKAGHLMYASHLSYTNDAMLGCDEADLLVDLARRREPQGLYGARITAAGGGGTVAVLCEQGERPDAALAEIVATYTQRMGHQAQLIATGDSCLSVEQTHS